MNRVDEYLDASSASNQKRQETQRLMSKPSTPATPGMPNVERSRDVRLPQQVTPTTGLSDGAEPWVT